MRVNYDVGMARGGINLGNMAGYFRPFVYPKEVCLFADRVEDDERYVGINITLSKEELICLIPILEKAREELATYEDVEKFEERVESE